MKGVRAAFEEIAPGATGFSVAGRLLVRLRLLVARELAAGGVGGA